MEPVHSVDALTTAGVYLRGRLDPHFATDTAAPGTQASGGSAGHCAAVALIFQAKVGGDLVSAMVGSSSHWFNRISTTEECFDIDLTGDQFGFPPVRVAPAGALFPGTRVRRLAEAWDETLKRAARLASRAGLSEIERSLVSVLEKRNRGRESFLDDECIPPHTP